LARPLKLRGRKRKDAALSLILPHVTQDADTTSQEPAERKQRQLFMVRPEAPLEPPPSCPEGFTLRPARLSDHDGYASLFKIVFPETHERFETLWESSLPGGFLVVADENDGIVASAAAAVFPKDEHPGGASLQWVMADPAHRGLGLGRIVVHAATRMLADSGQPYAYLSTDDWRLPAISIYLALGWKPLLYETDMPRRWAHVFTRLERPFNEADWPADPPQV
jgi:mycothiol synthase